MKHLYAMITNKCNLSCSHCDIKSNNDDYNESLFIDEINKFDGIISIFGGEPLLFKDRLINVLSKTKPTTISTNLINPLDDDIIPLFKDLNISTSWNYSRFTSKQYQDWLNNLKILNDNDLKCSVLITMTEDLITSNISEFINMIKFWNKEYPSIESILFEQLIDNKKTQEFYDRVDIWLCNIHKLWKENQITIINVIKDKVKYWYCDCTETFTLQPNGIIKNGCPHKNKPIYIMDCLTCDISDICRPCVLQQYCTYPKKYAKLIMCEK